MKVCFIVGTLGRGGAEKQLVFMLRALLRAGIEPRILCLTKDEDYQAEIISLGIAVEFVGDKQSRLLRLWKIIRNLRKQPAEIIQSSHFYTNIYAGLAGKILKIPSIGAIRSNLQSELSIHQTLGRFQISLPDFLIANSDSARRNAIEYGILPHKIEFVRNVVEIQPYEPTAPTPKETTTFLFAGRLGREKRPDRFVRLAVSLVEKYPNLSLRFQIAGDGVLRNEIEEQVRNNRILSGKFEFLGECAKMNEIYRQADVLVLTSDYEGTPNVILEAISNGLPVIATKVGGTSEIVNSDCGFLVDPNDESSLLEAASNLVENPESRINLGLNGLRQIKNNHSLETLTGCLTEIYSRLMSDSQKDFRLKETTGQNISSR